MVSEYALERIYIMSEKSIAKLNAMLNQDLTDYQSIPFWSWNNEMDETELVKQIEDMKSVGIGGFIMHARLGLKTEYLGEKWFSCIDACLKKAKELHMNAWVYDENGWPSGFVGGKMLENHQHRAQFLEYKVLDHFDNDAFCVFEKSDVGYHRNLGTMDGIAEYHTVYLRTSPANTDILNPEVVDEFIRQTHEEYYKRFADSFGKELAGFFTDEPQYYRWGTPYTRVAAQPYSDRYGEDIRDGLIYLFVHDANGFEFRTRYFKLLNELYTNNFYKKLYDWCTAHNCKLTGHSLEERSLRGQLMGGAGVMPSYRYEHIPAVDCLGRECPKEMMGKQVGSMASQFGIHQVLTETFACGGHDTKPMELKSIAESQYFTGVTMMCQHLFPYSFAAQAKYDHPPVFSRHGNWWEEFKTFNDYFTKLGFIISNTKDVYDILLIHPLRDVYLDHVHGDTNEETQQTDRIWDELLLDLRKKGITYQFADESILEDIGTVDGQDLVIGQCRYSTVVVPKMKSISSATVKLLKQFKGKLHLIETPAMIDGVPSEISLTSNITMEEIASNAQIKFHSEGLIGMPARRSDIGDFIFLKNYSKDESASCTMQNVAEHYRALDLETMTLQNISNEVTLEKCGSMILIRDEEATVEKKTETTEDITSAFSVTNVTDNYLVMDYASISYDGVQFGDVVPVQQFYEDLLRADYRGKLYVKHSFCVADIVPMKVLLEREKFISVTLNGRELTMRDNDFDINFVEADLTDGLHIGENNVTYCLDYYQHDGVHFALFDPLATESVRNCLYYDTNIENAYIQGDFIVDGKQIIHRRTSLPALSSKNYQNGYPFFKGDITLKGTYTYNGNGNRMISLDNGRFLVAQILINGQKDALVMSNKKDITSMLKQGENEIEIVLKSSLRNLFGPHHILNSPEPRSVGPTAFTMRGSWKGKKSEKYTDEYQCVPFGVDSIEMITV